ncbi:ribbon-helix-helix protein, CopG family [Luteolibacter flavescens]|uniref:Ribbon-helix-helix protein, CopG family n=1 Tax=Luteolibacter flavescens TaxID=1859460 RepID=A0ABT3FPI6_9BACT|nr:ribbon-helix-helix protein, CopG family [Luteolibacter flavescens]MCW1885491.1 ribbon-helix-helix protein, CopG family [Luteolibacter flavescens]
MAREIKDVNLTVRLNPKMVERLEALEKESPLSRAEITRQALDAVLRAFEATGQIEFPVTVTSQLTDPHSSPYDQLPDDVVRRVVTEHHYRTERAERLDAEHRQLVQLVETKPGEFLKQLEDYWESPEFKVPEDDDERVLGIHHKGRFQPFLGQAACGYALAGGRAPLTHRDDWVHLLSSGGWGNIMRVYGKGMHPQIPSGALVALDPWHYLDFPEAGQVVVYNTPHGFGIGELYFRSSIEGEKATSKGVPIARHINSAFPREYLLQPGDIQYTLVKVLGYPEMIDLKRWSEAR